MNKEEYKIYGLTYCHAHKRQFTCSECGKGPLQIDIPYNQIIQQASDRIPESLVDLVYYKESLISTALCNDSTIKTQKIAKENVLIRNYNVCFKAEHNHFPIK